MRWSAGAAHVGRTLVCHMLAVDMNMRRLPCATALAILEYSAYSSDFNVANFEMELALPYRQRGYKSQAMKQGNRANGTMTALSIVVGVLHVYSSPLKATRK